ncbi:MAG: AEC family transporter [Lachnospiraceae bacterium]|nr:AEC family transporter [Lachnospiraceae bacterium]
MGIVVTKALTMVLIILMGYILKRVRYLDKAYFPMLSRISLNIMLPCVIITKFSEFTMDYAFLIFVLIGLGLNLLTVGIGYVAGARRGRDAQAFYMINLSGFNIGSFALPFAQTFLGADGVVATCLFDAGNSMMCTGGTYALASTVAAQGEKQTPAAFLKKLFSSIPLDTYLIMLLLSILGLHLPAFITSFASTVGNANSFLAMLVIGVGLELHLNREQVRRVLKCLAFRYVFAAVLALTLYRLLPFSLEVRQAMALIAFAPLSLLCPVYTHRCGGDESLSSTLNSLSIVTSTVCMTVLLLLFNI